MQHKFHYFQKVLRFMLIFNIEFRFWIFSASRYMYLEHMKSKLGVIYYRYILSKWIRIYLTPSSRFSSLAPLSICIYISKCIQYPDTYIQCNSHVSQIHILSRSSLSFFACLSPYFSVSSNIYIYIYLSVSDQKYDINLSISKTKYYYFKLWRDLANTIGMFV